MAQPFVGEVRMFGTDYPPLDWMYCDGTIIQISQNQKLYSLMGNAYGGNGTSSFAVPNLKGRAVLNWGKGPGLYDHTYGGFGGAPSISLTEDQIPTHKHTLSGDSQVPETNAPDAEHMIGTLVQAGFSKPAYSDLQFRTQEPMAAESFVTTGGGYPHENRQPYLVIPFFVAIDGEYPARN